MIPYSVAPLARADLGDIWDRIASDNPVAADRLLDTLHEKFLLLASRPLLGELRPELRADLRSFSAGKYVIYYQVVASRLRVTRVLHGSRDLKRLF